MITRLTLPAASCGVTLTMHFQYPFSG